MKNYNRHAIHSLGSKTLESKQVAKRLRALLPQRLLQIQNSYTSSKSRSHALRQALLDQRYEHHIDELVNASYLATRTSIEREIRLLRWQVEQYRRNY